MVCHASAWDIDYVDDLRIKMCIEQKAEGFFDDSSRAGPQFLSAGVRHAAAAIPQQRERRISRSDWRYDRAFRDA